MSHSPVVVVCLTVILQGCVAPPTSRMKSPGSENATPPGQTGKAVKVARTQAPQDSSVTADALAALKAAMRYAHNPVVRAEAVEALEASKRPEAYPWIRSALLDEHAGVRFAACAAIGTLQDTGGEAGVRKCVNDVDPSVQVAALFALHRLGHADDSGKIPVLLLEHESRTVRRNAALLLGRLEAPSGVKVLARAMKDSDAGVRHHALEAMARLGNAEARQELVFMTNSGVGSEEVFAINALAELRSPVYEDTFRYKLDTALHLETRLAAARGLGLLGIDAGFRAATDGLRAVRPSATDSKDPPEGQLLRIHQLAAAALGAIGRKEALPALLTVLKDSGDPRLQVSAAKAILEIGHDSKAPASSFPSGRTPQP